MCKFFSLVSKGDGAPIYFDSKIRKDIISGKLKKYELDSHTSIADYFGYKGEKEDVLNKYEYNPITKVFEVDQLNITDDSKDIEKFCNAVDFKTIVPELNIHPIIHPFKDRSATVATKKDILLLKKWASVGASVWASVRDSVRDSVWASVRDSVRDSVGDSVRDSVGDSVGDSVRDSVGDSVWASVGAYTGSFFDIKYKVNIKPSNELWNKGIVPSFDGTLWRLHGKEGKVIYTISKEDLKKYKG
jgi:hypothetical protein